MMVLQNISCRVTRVPTKNVVPLSMIPASLNNIPPPGAALGVALSKMLMLEQKLQRNIDISKIT